MGINVSRAHSQAQKISQYAASLNELRNTLLHYKGSLNGNWHAEEVNLINQNIDSIGRELSQLQATLQSLSPDIISAANEIKREEDAREAAARAAAARQAALKKARLR